MTQNVRSDGRKNVCDFRLSRVKIRTYSGTRHISFHVGVAAGWMEEEERKNGWWDDDSAICFIVSVCVGGSVLRNLEGVADRVQQ